MQKSRIGANVLYNVVGMLAPLIATIMTVPAYLHTIGNARFGVLSLIWLAFGYFGLFDFGLSRATAHRLAQLQTATSAERSTVFFTALAMNTILGCCGAVIFYFVMRGFISVFSYGNSELINELILSLPYITVLVPMAVIGGVFTGSIEAADRFLSINIQQVVGGILLQCLPLLATKAFEPTLVCAVTGAAVARVISIIWIGVIALKLIDGHAKPTVSWPIAVSLLKYGANVAVTNALSPVLVSADQFIITSILGPSNLPYYSVPFSMVMKVQMLATATSRALFPRFSALGLSEAGRLADQANKLLALVMALVCILLIFVIYDGLKLWVGAPFAAASWPAACLLIVGMWINSQAFIPFALLQASGRPGIVARLHIIEIIPFLALLAFCVLKYGLVGAALAWTIRVLVDGILLFFYAGYSFRRMARCLWPGLFLIGSYITVITSKPTFLQACLMAAFVMSALAVIGIAFDEFIKERIRAIAARMRRRSIQ